MVREQIDGGLILEVRPNISPPRQMRHNNDLRWQSCRLRVNYERPLNDHIAEIAPDRVHGYIRELYLRSNRQGVNETELKSATLVDSISFKNLGALLNFYELAPVDHIQLFEWVKKHSEMDFRVYATATWLTVAGFKGFVVCEQNSVERVLDIVYERDIEELPSGSVILGAAPAE